MAETNSIDTEIKALEKSRDKLIFDLHAIERAIEIRRSILKISQMLDSDAEVRILINRHLINHASKQETKLEKTQILKPEPEPEPKKELTLRTTGEDLERQDNLIDSPLSSIGSAYSDVVIIDGQTVEVPPLV